MTEEVKDGEGKEEKQEVKLTEDETRAVSLGWKPKDQWQGDPNDWVPAKWWLRYGDVEQKVQVLEAENKHKEKVLASMKGHYVRVKDDAIKEAMDIIKRQKKAAIQAEDFEKVAELDVQAEQLENGLKGKFAAVDQEVNKDQIQQGPPPEFHSWNRENPWYQLGGADEVTKKADALAIGYVNVNPNMPYTEVLKAVTEDIKRLYPDKFKKVDPVVTAVDDVHEGREASSNSGKREKSYNLSPAEKEAAARFGMTEKEYAEAQKTYEQKRGRI